MQTKEKCIEKAVFLHTYVRVQSPVKAQVLQNPSNTTPWVWHRARLHSSFSFFLRTSYLLYFFLASFPAAPLHSSVPLSWTAGIFRYWSPHYSSIQPQQTHKQISCLRRSQSSSLSLLCRAIRPQHTPVRWARGKAYCRLQPPLAPPPNPSASQPCVTAAPNTIKSHLQNAQA